MIVPAPFFFPAKEGESKTLAPKKPELAVFTGRAARANSAIFEALARENPQTIKQLLKQIRKFDGLEETYYANQTLKRIAGNRLHQRNQTNTQRRQRTGKI